MPIEYTDDALISIRDFMKIAGFRSRTSIYRHVDNDPGFPRPVTIGTRSKRFRKSDVQRWMRGLTSQNSRPVQLPLL